MKLIFHTDPGHGWIECPFHLINKLGILGKISKYSYISRDKSKVYLEEDCDANLLVETLKNRGDTVEFEEKISNSLSFIRNLPKFNVDNLTVIL